MTYVLVGQCHSCTYMHSRMLVMHQTCCLFPDLGKVLAFNRCRDVWVMPKQQIVTNLSCACARDTCLVWTIPPQQGMLSIVDIPSWGWKRTSLVASQWKMWGMTRISSCNHVYPFFTTPTHKSNWIVWMCHYMANILHCLGCVLALWWVGLSWVWVCVTWVGSVCMLPGFTAFRPLWWQWCLL